MNALKISLLLVCTGGAAIAADHNWSMGQVIDTSATRNVVQTGSSFSSHSFGTATARTNGNVSGKHYSSTTDVSGQSTTFGGVRAHHTIFQDSQIVIQGVDYTYAVDDLSLKGVGIPTGYGLLNRAIQNRKHGCRMIVGERVQYDQVKDKLFVIDADGKICKLDIVRQERSANSQDPAADRSN